VEHSSDTIPPLTSTPANPSHGVAAERSAMVRWSDEVLAVAEQQHIRTYLDPMLEATRLMFPTARALQVYVQDDPEIAGVRNIIFDVQVVGLDVAGYRAAYSGWTAALLRIFSKPFAHTFYLMLDTRE
jgi:hypothetical protein